MYFLLPLLSQFSLASRFIFECLKVKEFEHLTKNLKAMDSVAQETISPFEIFKQLMFCRFSSYNSSRCLSPFGNLNDIVNMSVLIC